MTGAAALLPLAAIAGCSSETADSTATAAAALDGTPAPAAQPERRQADWGRLTGGAVTMIRSGETWQPALFLCDGTNRPVIHALALPEGEAAMLATLGGTPPVVARRMLGVGLAEPGAGQVYIPLGDDGGAVGHVRATNPGMLDDATLPTVMAVTVDGVETQCRWQPQARFLGVTERRAVLITGPVGGPYVYRAFDRGAEETAIPVDDGRTTRASLTVTRGRQEGDGWTFATGGTSYRVVASTGAGTPDPTLTVRRGGRVLSAERFVAYSIAAEAAATPPVVEARFACEDGSVIDVRFDNRADTAVLSLAGERAVTLEGQRPASGIWYAGSGYELRGRGMDATITGPDGTRRCRAR